MLLTGSFVRSIDEKLRVAIPKRLREALGETGARVVYVAPGTDGSLAIYPEPAFRQIAARRGHSSPIRAEIRDFRRLF